MLDLTISIVSYNTKDLLLRCLKSIYKYTQGISFEIIMVDNASTDGSAQAIKHAFPQIKLIRNRTNRFYTGANNQALKVALGKYFLILNSDMVLKQNALVKMLVFLDRQPQIGAIEPLQLYEHGQVIPTGSRHNTVLGDFFELTWLGRKLKHQKLINLFRLATKNRRRTWPAEVICDAALMTRTDLIRQFGGYDTNFKLYYTENDLCQRIQAAGFTTVHFAGATIHHHVSASTDQVGWPTVSSLYAADALTYYLKRGNFFSAWILYLSLKLNNLAVLVWKRLR